MSRKTLGLVGLFVVVVFIVYWWSFRIKPMTPLEEHFRAAFTRPRQLAPVSNDILIYIGGDNAQDSIPTVISHQRVPVSVILPQDGVPGVLEFLRIVPRLPSQDPGGFDSMDVSCDLTLGLNWPHPPALGEGREFVTDAAFPLKPGNYVLRFYRERMFFDSEKGPTRFEWIGQGQLRVTPSPSHLPGVTPMEVQKNLIPLYQDESEETE